jgi:hypothetical protein
MAFHFVDSSCFSHNTQHYGTSYNNTKHNIKPSSRRKGQDCMPFSSSVTDNFSCHSDSRGRIVGLCCCFFVQRWCAEKCREVDPLGRPSCPSSHVFQLTQKATLFHHDNYFCVATLFHHGRFFFRSRDSCFIIIVVVSLFAMVVFAVGSWWYRAYRQTVD